jgi:hypothetical protein
VCGATVVNIPRYPDRASLAVGFTERCADCQTRRNTPYRLVKETRVAGSQTPHQIVHRQFEGFRIGKSKNAVSSFAGELGPVNTIELRVEVILRNLGYGFVEYFSALSG